MQKVERDLGTPELQRKRRQLLQRRHQQKLSLSTLDALYAQDLIDKYQHQAGRSYAALTTVVRTVIQAPRLCQSTKDLLMENRGKRSQKIFQNHIPLSDKKCAAIEKKWRASQDVLILQGRQVLNYVNRVVIFDGVEAESIQPGSLVLQSVRQGLSALDECFSASNLKKKTLY
ncbi:MAG: hypothetical protein ABFQ95_03715 [Pseudomonadota bacterium]